MAENLSVVDMHPREEAFREAVLRGLCADSKFIPSKFLYDAKGSELFHQITETSEYYQTGAELEILSTHGKEIGQAIGESALIIELGSGNRKKILQLLECVRPAAYMPVDISRSYLIENATYIAGTFSDLPVHAICADFLQLQEVPPVEVEVKKRVVFFPGSTFGNFEPDTAMYLLESLKKIVGAGGQILLGIDLVKSTEVLEKAYNDASGYTEAFEMNILERVNRELGASFDLKKFEYEGFFNREASRIEMQLVSKEAQTVDVAGLAVRFSKGESIHVENSYKFDLSEFEQKVARVGLRQDRAWTDSKGYFAAVLLTSES